MTAARHSVSPIIRTAVSRLSVRTAVKTAVMTTAMIATMTAAMTAAMAAAMTAVKNALHGIHALNMLAISWIVAREPRHATPGDAAKPVEASVIIIAVIFAKSISVSQTALVAGTMKTAVYHQSGRTAATPNTRVVTGPVPS
ncbi:unnamed protein product [Nezara viridula]|uniref:Uncharacterized protein n=1 Tax=Nezara viridula TaxID=85310 RepID=A0A9P0E5N7_NEZVI|nr:unnamed protein product [Nezara viridula]